MTTERWREVKQLFNAAIACQPDERTTFLANMCEGDEDLRHEAQLLVAAHENSGEFIETPAYEIAPELLLGDPAALIGQRLGAYRIDALLGAGGMGVVYRAFDERLERKVALKLLPASFVDEAQLQPLRREARTASALNHPNIVTIHEVGEADSTHFIATEFIEGKTLRERMAQGPIAPNEALKIAIQVASALQHAHGAGIVHRDIKPENIMLRSDGIVKVLDFGIARWFKQAGTESEVIGTVRYMSPEQKRGEAIDARSDLWSLGVALSEMLGENRPARLQRVVERCLREDAAERYANAEALLADLHAAQEKMRRSVFRYLPWIALAAAAALVVGFAVWQNRDEPPPAREKSIAVLPFENLSAEKDDAFFADGIQDDILTSLGKIKRLKVIARASVMDYRGARIAGKIREIGQTLGVSHVLEGSVRRMGDRVVLNVALIDTRNERRLWTERYERTMTDAISLQGELAIEVARALQATLTPAEAMVAAAKPTQNPEAYLLYLRGRESEIANSISDQLQPAIQLYQHAVDLDPKFALARARLSLCANVLGHYDLAQWREKARAEAEEAVRLQPQLGEARLALTHCYLWEGGDNDRALAELTRTAELLPNSAEVPLTAAFIYKRQNRFRDRIAALQRAEALDPRNRKVLGLLTITYRWVRDWPEALQSLDRKGALGPELIGKWWWAWSRENDEFRLGGDINVLKKAIVEEPDGRAPGSSDWLKVARYDTAMLERDYMEAARLLSAIPPKTFSAAIEEGYGHSKAFNEALLAVTANTDAAARQQALEVARDEAKTRLVGKDGTDDEQAYADLALLYAFLGRKEEAIREALRAVDAVKLNNTFGTIEKNDISSALAMVYAQTGEAEQAIDLIERLLTAPTQVQRGAVYNMTLTDLKWRWQWDPLRSHPRFQKLLAGPEPKTVY